MLVSASHSALATNHRGDLGTAGLTVSSSPSRRLTWPSTRSGRWPTGLPAHRIRGDRTRRRLSRAEVVLDCAARHSSSHPFAASEVAKHASRPSRRAGARPDRHAWQAPLRRDSSATSAGSACAAAVAFHSTRTCAKHRPPTQLCRRTHRPYEVRDEQPVRGGEQVRPRELLDQNLGCSFTGQVCEGVAQRPRRAHSAVSCQRGGVLSDHQQRNAVSAPHPHITLVSLRSDTLGVALQIAPLHLSRPSRHPV
jgi:hypothetical protein